MSNNLFRVASGLGHGKVPNLEVLLGSGLSVAELRSATPMEADAQRIIDRTVVQVGLERLVVVADILAAGLTYPLADPLSVLEINWQQESKSGGAQRTMDPRARGENQLPDRRTKRLPVYLTTDDFNLGVRTLRASERVGAPLDTSGVATATRRVNEAIEDAMINGAGLQIDGMSTPGLLNAPNVNTITLTSSWNTAWSSTLGESIRADVMRAISKLQSDKKYGPYGAYVGVNYGNALTADFKANGDRSILSRLREIVAGGRNFDIKVADQMPDDTLLVFQMTSDVVDIVTGMSPTNITWKSPDGFTFYNLVMAIMIPRVRDDYDGNSGIVVGTPA